MKFTLVISLIRSIETWGRVLMNPGYGTPTQPPLYVEMVWVRDIKLGL